MSEAPPETRAPSRSSSGSGGNVLTHRLGPLPTWVWIAIAAALIIAYSWWKSKSANAASSANTSASSTPADQVPQFVNQTYTTVTPPPANVTVNNTTPAPAPVTQPTAPGPVQTGTPSKEPPPSRAPATQPPIFNKTYIVKKGETLNSIAKSLHISRVDLAHANGLGTGAGLRTGQTLKVPSPAPGGTPNRAQ